LAAGARSEAARPAAAERSPGLRTAVAILVCASPVVLHFAVARESRALMVAFLVLVALGIAAAGLPRWVAGLAALAAVGAAWVDLRAMAQIALAGPALAFLLVAWVFGRTLLPGRTPLVEQISRVERGGDFPAGLAGYTRGLTWAWAALLALLPVADAALALFATAEAQSFFVNFGSWALIALLFFGEYAYRRWRYPQFPHKNPLAVARNLVRCAPGLFRARDETATTGPAFPDFEARAAATRSGSIAPSNRDELT
jgi:uncharacterized membrane protein